MIGWIVYAGSVDRHQAPGFWIGDAQNASHVAAELEELRDKLAGPTWQALPVAGGLAVKATESPIMIFRRSAREICLLSSPIIELPEADWPTDAETRAHVTLATDVLRVAPLNEDAAEVGELGDAESVEVGIMGTGVLARVEPGDYRLTYARRWFDEDSRIELVTLIRE